MYEYKNPNFSRSRVIWALVLCSVYGMCEGMVLQLAIHCILCERLIGNWWYSLSILYHVFYISGHNDDLNLVMIQSQVTATHADTCMEAGNNKIIYCTYTIGTLGIQLQHPFKIRITTDCSRDVQISLYLVLVAVPLGISLGWDSV